MFFDTVNSHYIVRLFQRSLVDCYFIYQAVDAHANAMERGVRSMKDAGRLTGLRKETEEEFWERLQREEEEYAGSNPLDVSHVAALIIFMANTFRS